MIWLTWRQFRSQALVAVAALGVLATYLVLLGLRTRHAYEINVNCGIGCSLASARQTLERQFRDTLLLSGFLVLLVPAIIGAFWGAPLIAREIETGTYRLVWNQSVTRTRWLAVKLGFVTLVGVAVAGVLSLLFTWAASPYDKVVASRFEPILFPTRNIAPLGYAAFAVVAGVTIGLLARRTVLAMAITLALFTAVQILMPTVIRPHLRAPVTTAEPFSAAAADGISLREDGDLSVEQYSIPGAWVLTPNRQVLDAAGNPVGKAVTSQCMSGSGPGATFACLETKNLHLDVTYQPASRYWSFQWLELTFYLVLAGLLAGFTFWRIPRGLS